METCEQYCSVDIGSKMIMWVGEGGPLRQGAINVESHYRIPDDRLRLIFTCCHPAIALDAQVALTLRTLCGLDTDASMASLMLHAGRRLREVITRLSNFGRDLVATRELFAREGYERDRVNLRPFSLMPPPRR